MPFIKPRKKKRLRAHTADPDSSCDPPSYRACCYTCFGESPTLLDAMLARTVLLQHDLALHPFHTKSPALRFSCERDNDVSCTPTKRNSQPSIISVPVRLYFRTPYSTAVLVKPRTACDNNEIFLKTQGKRKKKL